MSLSLPGNDLYWLSKIIWHPKSTNVSSVLMRLGRVFVENMSSMMVITLAVILSICASVSSIFPRINNVQREHVKKKNWKVGFSGDVVMLSNMYGPARLFYINEEGQLRYNDPLAFGLNGVSRVVKEYNASVGRRDYQRTGGKPRPTKSPIKVRTSTPVSLTPKAFPPINSKIAGHLLAAGGDAAKRFDQVLNEQTAVATAISAAGRRGGDINSLNENKELQQIKRKEEIGKWSLDELLDGAKHIDPASKKGDLTLAGRALQKHGSREGSAFPPAQGNPLTINAQGQNIVEGILNDPDKIVIQSNTGRYGQVTDIISSSGRGLRYDANGKLIGFWSLQDDEYKINCSNSKFAG